MLSKTRSVLDHAGTDLGLAVFGDLDAEIVDGAPEGSDRLVVIGEADWRELGEPQQITVTIRPGDRLN